LPVDGTIGKKGVEASVEIWGPEAGKVGDPLGLSGVYGSVIRPNRQACNGSVYIDTLVPSENGPMMLVPTTTQVGPENTSEGELPLSLDSNVGCIPNDERILSRGDLGASNNDETAWPSITNGGSQGSGILLIPDVCADSEDIDTPGLLDSFDNITDGFSSVDISGEGKGLVDVFLGTGISLQHTYGIGKEHA